MIIDRAGNSNNSRATSENLVTLSTHKAKDA